MSNTESSPEHARHAVFGRQHDRIFERLTSLDPSLAEYIRDFAYDTVYDRGSLDLKTQELLACTLLLTLGSPDELKTHLRGSDAERGHRNRVARNAAVRCALRGLSEGGGGLRAAQEPAGREAGWWRAMSYKL